MPIKRSSIHKVITIKIKKFTNTIIKMHQCELCSASFNRKWNLNRHYDVKHSESESENNSEIEEYETNDNVDNSYENDDSNESNDYETEDDNAEDEDIEDSNVSNHSGNDTDNETENNYTKEHYHPGEVIYKDIKRDVINLIAEKQANLEQQLRQEEDENPRQEAYKMIRSKYCRAFRDKCTKTFIKAQNFLAHPISRKILQEKQKLKDEYDDITRSEALTQAVKQRAYLLDRYFPEDLFDGIEDNEN